MPAFFERVRLIAVLFGGVVCIPGAAVPARGQDAATAAQVNRSEAVLSTRVGSLLAGGREEDTFAAFLREIGADDLAACKEAITGQKQLRVDWVTVNHASIGLSEKEWNTAYAILVDGSQRISDWSDEVQDALGWKEGRFQADPTQRTVRMARFDMLNAQGDSIVDVTVAALREKLGPDAFSKLDAFVIQRESGKPAVEPEPIKKGPVETAKVTPPTTK
jgi:hypothetical protein